MSTKDVDDFKEQRNYLNNIVMKYAKTNMKRFYALDSKVYLNGALSRKTKEMMGLVASLVLRCDDCVEYHIIKCYEEGVTDSEFEEVLSIALVVGGSITIPHIRRAFKIWDELKVQGDV